MKISISILLYIFILNKTVEAQSCLPNGIIFTRQSQLDSFPILYPGCKIIEGNLVITGIGNDVHSLLGLYNIEQILGELRIEQTSSLTSLQGLGQLQTIGRDMVFTQNSQLKDFSGLGRLKFIHRDLVAINNHYLENFTGLDSLQYVDGHLEIRGQSYLTSLTGLSALREIGGKLNIQSNNNLDNLQGLSALTSIGESLLIASCPDLDDLSGLTSLTALASLYLNENDNITSLSGLNNVTSLSQNLFISRCNSLTDLTALSNATGLKNYISLGDNSSLTNLSGLNNLFENKIEYVTLARNESLDGCAILSVCEHLSLNGTAYIYENAIGCSSKAEVQNACLVDVDDPTFKSVNIFPNPNSGIFNLTGLEGTTYTCTVFNLHGQIISQWDSYQLASDLTYLTPGIYMLRLQSASNTAIRKFSKQ